METHRPALITVVLPAYNECEGLPVVIASISAALAETGLLYEILVVDDGSTDATRVVMHDLNSRQPNLHYIRLSRNFGKEAALSAGLKAASGDAVILMDADGQHPVELIPEFLALWRDGYETVVGVQHTRNEGWLKARFRRLYYSWMATGGSVPIPADAGDFRLLDRKVVDAINELPERNRLMKGLFAWVGFRTALVPFEAKDRVAGQTKFTWIGLLRLAFTGLTSFTVIPLRIVSMAGIAVSCVSLVYGFYLLFEHYVQGNQMPGWATLSVGMMLLSGIQLLALGVISEYLGRTFEEVKQRPIFIVAEDTRPKATPNASPDVYEKNPTMSAASIPESPTIQ